MPKKQPQLAKLSRPRLYNPVARERLFRLLDERREHPVVWIAGPPGAGKTTLVASYLEEARLPAIWFQLDAGDSDPAGFFYYLKEAIESRGRRPVRPLPLLTGEYLSEAPAFARQFLRRAFSELEDDAVIVLDNYQEIAENSVVHAALSEALEEIPHTANIIFVSRALPPSAFSERQVKQVLAMVLWDDLRLTIDEVELIASDMKIADRELFKQIHGQCGGWMAGATLMLENLRRGGDLAAPLPSKTLDTVFDYFAGLVLENASSDMSEVLMKTAFLPWVSPGLATAVSGLENAIRYPAELHRRHLFTDLRVGDPPTYHYHALFTAFLKSRARRILSVEVCREVIIRAAEALVLEGNAEEAFTLFVDAQGWGAAETIILGSASALIAQGRSLTVANWIECLPVERVERNPWLQYWLGRSRIFVEPIETRPALESAFCRFVEAGDRVGQMLCATTILESLYLEFDNIRPMDVWVEHLVSMLQDGNLGCCKEDELRAYSAVMMGATVRAPRHSMLPTCKRKVIELLDEPFDPAIKVAAASMLNAYSNVAMDEDAERIAIRVSHPLLDGRQVTGPTAIFYWNSEGYTHYLHGRYDQALACFDAADEAAVQDHCWDGYWVSVGFRRGLSQRRAGLLNEAEATIRQIERRSKPVVGHEAGGLDLLRAGVAFDRGDVQQAMIVIRKAYDAFDASGHFNGLVLTGLVAANIMIAGSDFNVANQILSRLRGEDYGTVAENYLAAVVLNQAWLAHRKGSLDARTEHLREALQRSMDRGARVRLRWFGNALSELLPIALKEGIETESARNLAREFAVVPSPSGIEAWPWPVKVRTLGTFELLLDGELPNYSRKFPKKVLALLKAIIAFGGTEVPEKRLTDALWPDDEGDSARRSLTATLHRLRKLLSCKNAVIQTEGRLSLNSERCWVDALVIDEKLGYALDTADAEDTLFRLYRGPFLEQEEDAPWILAMRERLRVRFIQSVARRSARLEADGLFEQALDLYERGIAADALVESFYQGLMRCYLTMDRRAEGASAYRRLRQTLSVILGVQPSVASQRLFQSLRS